MAYYLHYIWQNQGKYPYEVLGISKDKVNWERVRAFVLASTAIALQDGERPLKVKDFQTKK